MKSNRPWITAVFASAVVAACLSSAAGSVGSARRAIAELRYDRAEAALVDIAKSARGGERQEALYLLAGLKRSVSEAEIIYQEVIRIDPSSEWAQKAQLELAKIQYALGDYGRAYRILDDGEGCRHSQEACYFQGLSAAMMKRYSAARETLSRVRSGRFRPWAYLSLAEIEMEEGNAEAACRQYRAMARSGISPTAMYRYGECLEKQGETEDAAVVFAEVTRRFENTPEALLAAQKLDVLHGRRGRAAPPQTEPPAEEPITTGFTIQFGAFRERTNAIKLAADIKRHLPTVRIDSEVVNNQEVHRVRYGYFQTREEAQKKADEISDQIGEPCTIMTLP